MNKQKGGAHIGDYILIIMFSVLLSSHDIRKDPAYQYIALQQCDTTGKQNIYRKYNKETKQHDFEACDEVRAFIDIYSGGSTP